MKKALWTLIVSFIIVILVCAVAYAQNRYDGGYTAPSGGYDISYPAPFHPLVLGAGLGYDPESYIGPPPSPPLQGYFGSTAEGLLLSPTSITAMSVPFSAPFGAFGSNYLDLSLIPSMGQITYDSLTGVGLSNVLSQYGSLYSMPNMTFGRLGSSMVEAQHYIDIPYWSSNSTATQGVDTWMTPMRPTLVIDPMRPSLGVRLYLDWIGGRFLVGTASYKEPGSIEALHELSRRFGYMQTYMARLPQTPPLIY